MQLAKAEICRSNGHLKVSMHWPAISEPTKENTAESGYTGRHGPKVKADNAVVES